MKSIVLFAAVLAVAVAFPQRRQVQQQGAETVLVRETPSDNIGLDGYRFGYELSDGQVRDESAQVEVRGPEDAVLRVQGSYSFLAKDGQLYTITYIADENGFQPQGDHLPK